ncbi:MAG: T9SS type A sorting domain-containing protein [Cytophagales bacterium]|nr:T9SS type A sorting domain-containing protein [Cytophaga sp.]
MKLVLLNILTFYIAFIYSTDLTAQYGDCATAGANPVLLADPYINTCDQWVSNVMNLSTAPIGSVAIANEKPKACPGGATPTRNYWAAFIVPPNAGPTINMDVDIVGSSCTTGDLTDLRLAVYQGNGGCGHFAARKGSCNVCSSTQCSRIKMTDAVNYLPGDTLYVQITEGNDFNCDFVLKVFFTPLFDNCSQAVQMEQKVYCNRGGTLNDPIIKPAAACSTKPPNQNSITKIDSPIWFSFTVSPSDPQPYTISMDNISCVKGKQSLQMMVYTKNCNCSTDLTPCYITCTTTTEPVSSTTLMLTPGAGNPGNALPPGNYLLAVDGGNGADCQWGFNNTSMPVKFLNVVVSSLNSYSAQLKWLVADESESDYYEIQRSTDGVHFTSIGMVQSKNQSTLFAYSFQDYDVSASSYYYQIIMHDLDGSITSSSMVHLKTERNDIVVLPTLIKENFFNIKSSSTELATIEVLIHSVSGRLVMKKTFSSSEQLNSFVFEVNDWSNGMYLITIFSPEEKLIKKIEVLR